MMSQPIMYIFYALVAALILFFGVRVIFDTKDSAEKVEFEVFVNDLKQKINTVYQDSYGSTISLESLTVPKTVKEVCFVGSLELENIYEDDLKDIIPLDDENNMFFSGIDLKDNPRRFSELLVIDGTICDRTIDRKINLILENVGERVEVMSLNID